MKVFDVMAQVQEKRLETARAEELMLEQQRQFHEELGPGADKDVVKSSKATVDATNKDQVPWYRMYGKLSEAFFNRGSCVFNRETK